MPSSSIFEPGRDVPVAGFFDVCVVGGSCTGVFAAVRAARLGYSVALVEQNVILGGMATAAQVTEWHSLEDAPREKRIIGGLTWEVLQRLLGRGAARELPPTSQRRYMFCAAELALELDRMVREAEVRVFLSARFAAALATEGPGHRKVSAVFIEDKSGRRAIKARIFIDASGDGDLIRRSGFPAEKREALQPVTMQALVAGLAPLLGSPQGADLWKTLRPLAPKYGYPQDNANPWIHPCPGAEEVANIFGPRRNGVDASDADALTEALMEGRRQHAALLDLVAGAFNVRASVVAWPHALGVRETWHAKCLHCLSGDELLRGEAFPDAIANGTYPVDIHHAEGTVLRYLDGTEEVVAKDGSVTRGRWRQEENGPRCYHIPYGALIPEGSVNVLVAGRILGADRDAYGAVRVMVNTNQTGEAAGVAAAIAVAKDLAVTQVDAAELRGKLIEGGSIL